MTMYDDRLEEAGAAARYHMRRDPELIGHRDEFLALVLEIVNMSFYEAAIKAYSRGIEVESNGFKPLYVQARSRYPSVARLSHYLAKGYEIKFPRQADLFGVFA